MIIVTETRKIKVSSGLSKEIDENWLVFRNKYGVIRLKVDREKIICYGNGIDNVHSEIEVIE